MEKVVYTSDVEVNRYRVEWLSRGEWVAQKSSYKTFNEAKRHVDAWNSMGYAARIIDTQAEADRWPSEVEPEPPAKERKKPWFFWPFF